VELLFFGICRRVDIKFVFDDAPAYAGEIGGGLGENITVFYPRMTTTPSLLLMKDLVLSVLFCLVLLGLA
jgi:hypothetical protein